MRRQDVELKDIDVANMKEDGRPAFVLDSVEGAVELQTIAKPPKPSGVPTLVMMKAEGRQRESLPHRPNRFSGGHRLPQAKCSSVARAQWLAWSILRIDRREAAARFAVENNSAGRGETPE